MRESVPNQEQDPQRLAKKFERFLAFEIERNDIPLSTDISIDQTDDTFIVENEDFVLSFTFDNGVFAILSIEVTNRERGYGRKLVEIIHKFSEMSALSVEARKVEDGAIGFWETMGYEEGTEPGTYHYNG